MMEVESVPVEQLGALWEEALGGSGADGNGAHSGSSGNGACSASCGSSSGSSDDGSPATVRRPTWRIVPGTSTESLALEVARKCRLPDEVGGWNRFSLVSSVVPPLEEPSCCLVHVSGTWSGCAACECRPL